MCMCMCMCMVTKTISIMDDAYDILISKKRENESFSEVIRRISGKEKDIMRFAGVWSSMSDKDTKAIEKNILLTRKKATEDLLRKLKK
jgi:predicted CopG family antitoxin